MHTVAYPILLLALAGTAGSTIFLAMAMVAAARYRRRAPRQHQVAWEGEPPAVSMIKPLHGDEPRLKENLESFFQQDYPQFELLFCARQRNDAALLVVEELRAQYPEVDCTVLTCGEPTRPNAKVLSLDMMLRAAKHEFLVMADSDVQVGADYLREVVRPLLDRKNGVVTCLYRGFPIDGFWSKVEALGMSVEMPSGVLIADMLEGMRFALGPTIAMRRDSLDAIGGVAQLADYCAEDFLMGELAHQRGYVVVLSSYVVEHMSGDYGFLESWKHQVRWMLSTRFSRPAGHFGTGITFAMPYGVLGLIACSLLGHPLAGAAMLAWAFTNRVLQAVMIGSLVMRDPLAVRYCWLYPLRDLLGFFVWLASYAGSDVVWRGERYRVITGGKMLKLADAQPGPSEQLSG